MHGESKLRLDTCLCQQERKGKQNLPRLLPGGWKPSVTLSAWRGHRGTEPKSENELPWTDVCLQVRTRDSQTCSQPVLGWVHLGWPPSRSSGEGSANPQGNDVPVEISGTAERLLYVGSHRSACGRALPGLPERRSHSSQWQSRKGPWRRGSRGAEAT